MRVQSYKVDTILKLIVNKGAYFINIVLGVTGLVLCTLTNYGLHLYQVSRKYLERFLSCGAGTICDGQTDR